MKVRHIEIPLKRTPAAPFIDELEGTFAVCDLRITMKSSTASLPGSTHWHLKRERLAGTLEATLWPRENRLWLSVQDGRRAPWIDEALPEIVAALERVCGTSNR